MENYRNNIGKWNNLAMESGNLMVEGISSSESALMLRALNEPMQVDLLNGVNPLLAQRTIQVRNNIDKISKELTKTLIDKAGITDSKIIKQKELELSETIKGNLGSYVKRVYEQPQKAGLFPSLSVKEPKIYERGKIAREIYEKGLTDKINIATKELNRLSNVNNLSGVGEVTKMKFNVKGIKTIDDLINTPKQELANILMLELKNKMDTPTRQLFTAIDKIDNEINGLNRIYKQRGLTPTIKKGYAAIDPSSKEVLKRAQPIKSQIALEQDIFTRIANLEDGKQRLVQELAGKGNKVYLEAEAKVEGLIDEANKLVGKQRGLIGKINEYNNLIEKPLKQPDIPYDVRKRLGQIETGGVPVFKSISDAGYKTETARLFNSIATDFRLSSINETKGWVQLADNETKGSLAGMYVHPAVAKDIERIEKVITDKDRFINTLLRTWKIGKTALNPGTHGRNIISNITLLEASGTPLNRIPDLLSSAIDDVYKNTPLFQELKNNGIASGNFTQTELEELRNLYKVSDSNFIEKLLSKSRTALKPFNSLIDLYGKEETIFKVAKARHLIEQGFTYKNAVQEAEKWIFNYGKIPDFIKTVRDAPLGAPFITFQYKVIPRIFEALVKNPIDVIKYPLLLSGLEQYSKDKFNLSDSDMALLKRKQPLTYLLPFTDNQNQLRMFNLQYILPYGQMFNINQQGLPVGTLGLGGNPMFSTPYNLLVTNKDPFTGKDIIEKNSNIYRQFSSGMDFVGKQLLPSLTPYVGYSADTIQKSLNGIPLNKYGERPDYWLEIFGIFTGMRTRPTTIPTASWRFMNEINAIKITAEKAGNKLINDQSVPIQEKESRYKEIYSDMIRTMQKEMKIFNNNKLETIK